MSARPGSSWWLLRHELRLFWASTVATRNQAGARRTHRRALGGILLLWAALHAAAFALLHTLAPRGAVMPHVIVVAISAILLATFLFMLSSGLKASVETLFVRGDMDLLLSSPLPSRSIFTVKLAGIAFKLAAIYLFLLSPLGHVGVVLGQWHWLAIYPLLCALAMLAAACAMLLTLALVRLLGARRTRVVAQVLGALAGALLFLLTQAGQLMSGANGAAAPSAVGRIMRAAATLDRDSLLLLPAHAALGAPAALALLTMTAGLTACFTVQLSHRFFVHGLQQAASQVRVATSSAPLRWRFGRSLSGAIIAKEWRLIRRDPHLISQVLLQLLYLLPLCLLIVRKDALQLPSIAAGLTMLCGSLGAALAAIMLLAEDAPALLRSSPAHASTVRRAKLLAAVLPVWALAALPLLWLTLRAPRAGVITLVCVLGSVANAALINLWTGRATPRSQFKGRGKHNLVTRLLEMCSLLAWAGVAMLLVRLSAGAALDMMQAGAIGAAATIALGSLPIAWLLRQRAA